MHVPLQLVHLRVDHQVNRFMGCDCHIEIVFRWLKRVLRLDELISVSPKGLEMQVAVALIVYGLMLLYHTGDSLSLKALQRRLKTALNEAIFAAGVAEGWRQARARPWSPGPPPPLLPEVG